MPLTDSQQAVLMFVSAILLAIAGVSVPAGLPTWVTLILGILGAAGMAIKEMLGSVPKPAPKPAVP